MFVSGGYLLLIVLGILLALGGALLGFLPAFAIVGLLIVLAILAVTAMSGSREDDAPDDDGEFPHPTEHPDPEHRSQPRQKPRWWQKPWWQ